MKLAVPALAVALCGCNALVDLDGLAGGGAAAAGGAPAATATGSGGALSGGAGPGGAGAGGDTGCAAGLADCDGQSSNGCEVSLATDHDNCGICGRDCGEGDCVAGACPPLLLAGGQQGPHDIASRAGQVYWVNWETGALMKCAATGCGGNPMQLGVSGNFSFYIDLDDTNVYWNNNGAGALVGSMWRCPIDQGCDTDAPWIPTVSNPTQVGVGDTHVYWHSNDGTIQRTAKGGFAVEDVVTGIGNSGDVQPDGMKLYWTEREINRVRGCELADVGCGPEILSVSGAWESPDILAIDATHVYFATDAGNDEDVVARVDKVSGALDILVSSRTSIRGLAVTDTHVYFGESFSGTVQKVPKGGGSLQIVADGLGGAIARIAAGSGFVFVTINETDGEVWRFSW